jgi:pyroglutamyl-peptidase
MDYDTFREGMRPRIRFNEGSRLKILLTAFEPYDTWSANSSWEALTELLKTRGVPPGVTTRRYPVDLDKLHERLGQDLERGFDAVLHLGQAPGACAVHLEAIALNVAGVTHGSGGLFGAILPEAPVAYRSHCPLARMCTELHSAGIPASISYHAGTYLCNAVLYLTHHWHAIRKLPCPIAFAHLPLTLEQTLHGGREMPGIPKSDLARAIDVMLTVLRESISESPGLLA